MSCVLLKEVRKRTEEVNKNLSDKIKIEEKGVLKIRDILVAQNPFKTRRCTKVTCPLCSKSEYIEVTWDKVKVPCNDSGATGRGNALHVRKETLSKFMRAKPAGQQEQGGLSTLKIY